MKLSYHVQFCSTSVFRTATLLRADMSLIVANCTNDSQSLVVCVVLDHNQESILCNDRGQTYGLGSITKVCQGWLPSADE